MKNSFKTNSQIVHITYYFRVEDLRDALHMFGTARCESGEEMATLMR